MKKWLLEYLIAYRQKQVAENRRKWQRIHRLGRGRFILLVIVLTWLFVAGPIFIVAWWVDPSLNVLHRWPYLSYRELCWRVPVVSVCSYFFGAYIWRRGERMHGR